MPVLYQICDLFCLPSKGPGETWGLSVNEAMAAGKAVLVSDKAGCAYDLIDNNGLVFISQDIQDLTEKLKLLSDKNKLKAMGNVSREIISSWSLDSQINVFERELNKL
jgi:glycosyltransferase involved in cell wall biosynthesis